MYDLVVIGHLLKERIIFADGRKIGPVLGSPAAYSATAAARTGAKVGLVSLVGRDMPDELLDILYAAGIDMQGVYREERGTEDLLIYDEAGNKRLEFIHKARQIEFNDIPEDYLKARMFLICPIDYEMEPASLQALYRQGSDMAVDIGGYGGASSQAGRYSIREKIDYLEEIAPYFKVIKGSREDIQRLYGNDTPGDKAFMAELVARGVPLSIVTCGADGALLQERRGIHRVPVFTGSAIDTTGAGDSWFGAFLAEYIKAEDAYRSAVYASAFASIMVEQSGGVNMQRMPGRKEVEERIKREDKLCLFE
ncbi:MAG: carbohydrate kinase family protein [bacterium]|jgi:sugar/nucleoside kinase (ribokinase family)|nr:carbohydrate kinase family protein [bacterium]